MIKKYAARAHGKHNPQHGGQFFMAPDSWHHIEGTYLPTGVFRMHLYDDYTKPLTLKLAREISGTLVVKIQRRGRKGRPARAKRPVSAGGDWQAAVPGADVREGRLQARRSRHPLRLQLRRLLERTEGRALGDDDHSDAGDVTGTNDAGSGHAAGPCARSVLDRGSGFDSSADSRDGSRDARAAPHAHGSDSLVHRQGAFAAIYVPAFQAKDLALALDEHKKELSDDRQRVAVPAIARLVRSAYLLDAFGDLGNKQQILEAYDRFSSAVKEIESAFPARP
jgi:hypothetical protein